MNLSAAIRQDVSGLIDDEGLDCAVLRRAVGRDSAGRDNGAFATVSTDRFWIQPFESSRAIFGQRRLPAGVLSDVTHIATKRYGTTPVKKEDRVQSPGSPFVYDVIEQENWDTHTNVYLQLVKRSA